MNDDVERPPWWLSGDGDGDSDSERSSNSEDQASWGGLPSDMWSLLGTVSSMAGEWWAASGASEHTGHQDPDSHPECAICRVLVSVRTVTAPPEVPSELPPPQWLPLRRL